MDELIQALQIFRRYGNPKYPFHCEHDVLMICGIDPADVSEEDREALETMGFLVSQDSGYESFISYRYGSA